MTSPENTTGEHGAHPRRGDSEALRDLVAQTKSQRRLLHFLNDAQFPEQLMVAPNDRISIEEAIHHTDHAEHFEHLKPQQLFDRNTAEQLIVTRNRAYPLRGFATLDEVIALNPNLADILGRILARFSAASYGRADLLYDLEVGGTHIEIEHAALLRTYEVIFLANGTNTLLWDPSDETTPLFSLLSGATTGLTANLLCGGHSFLSDGQLLTVGGGGFGPGTPTTNQGWKFDPVARTWTRTAGDMSTLRWYPTALSLGDEAGPTGQSGRVLIAGGASAGGAPMEIYSEALDTFSTVMVNGPITKSFPQTYPGLHLLPGSEIFYVPTGFGNCGTGSTYSLSDPSAYFTFSSPQGALDGSWTNLGSVTNRTKGMSAILLRPSYPFVRVVVVGGGDSTTSATAQQINLSTLSPAWSSPVSVPDARARVNVNVVLLPDGTLFVCGGTQATPHTCWIYNPDTPISPWKEMDELNAPRHYHSCALLLPNGKVMVAGGAAPGGCTASVENTIEVFSPPYLYKPDGSLASRPTIDTIDGVTPTASVAPTVHHGATFVIETADAVDISRVVLVRPMAATHQTETEQRVIQCTSWQSGSTSVSAIAPDGGHPHAIAPRGYYMLFILNTLGVPSEGKFIHLH
jgi:hypothetical protein